MVRILILNDDVCEVSGFLGGNFIESDIDDGGRLMVDEDVLEDTVEFLEANGIAFDII